MSGVRKGRYGNWALCLLLFFGLVFLHLGKAAAQPTLEEVRWYWLPHKTVLAIGIDEVKGEGEVADPLAYKLEPVLTEERKGKNLDVVLTGIGVGKGSSLASGRYEKEVKNSFVTRIFLTEEPAGKIRLHCEGADGVVPKLSMVKRKRVLGQNGQITFRTYIVVSFARQMAAKTIVVDAGHGGKDPGAVQNGLQEKDLNLDTACRIRNILEEQPNWDVYMTREDDTFIPLLDRADAANILQADLFLSIHHNSMPPDISQVPQELRQGTGILYNSDAVLPAKEVAGSLCDNLAADLQLYRQPLQHRPGLVVLNSTWVPSVIVEVAMIADLREAYMIAKPEARQKAAESISRTIIQYFRGSK